MEALIFIASVFTSCMITFTHLIIVDRKLRKQAREFDLKRVEWLTRVK